MLTCDRLAHWAHGYVWLGPCWSLPTHIFLPRSVFPVSWPPPSCPSNDKPSYFSPQDLCTCCLPLSECSSFFLQAFWRTSSFSAFWSQPKCHLSLTLSLMLLPTLFLGSHYWLLVCFLYSYGHLGYIFIFSYLLFFSHLIWAACSQGYVSYSILNVYPTLRVFHFTIGLLNISGITWAQTNLVNRSGWDYSQHHTFQTKLGSGTMSKDSYLSSQQYPQRAETSSFYYTPHFVLISH